MSAVHEHEVIVVGGGPAGAAAAATLARLGRDVVLIDRHQFPRYSVGESLLPYAWWTLDRIGALEAVSKAGFQAKHSVRFVSANGEMSRPFSFTDHLDHPAAATWQVERSAFDQLLLDNARAQGAVVREQTRGTALIEEQGRVCGVVAEGPDGQVTLRAPITIDASGRDGFVRTLRRWRNPEPALQRLSYWTYYEGVALEEGLHRGATTIVQLPEDGWFWFFPMGDGRVSVGVVALKEVLFKNSRDPETVWAEQIALNPWLAAQLATGARCDGLRVTTDYSFRSEFCADAGVVLAGDAFAFLDPVFSSGVFLALRTGEEAALAAHAALQAGEVGPEAFAAYGEWACGAIEAMRALVFSFYEPKFSMGKLMRARPDLRGDVTDLLIGNLERDFRELFAALAEHGSRPPSIPYGRAKAVGA